MNPDLCDPVWWHNCPAPEPRAGLPGFMLPRYPAVIRTALNPAARWRALDSCGVELRFVTEAPTVRVTVGSHAGGGEVIVWRGDIFVSRQNLTAEAPVTLVLEPPPRLQGLPAGAPVRSRYSPRLWRIEFSRCNGLIYSLDACGLPIRPPRPDEIPARRWLAYGSSITHADARGYVAQAARILGVDALNKGLAGSCHAEQETAEYFVASERWDFCTAELGVNMRDSFTPEAFNERATGWLDTVHKAMPTAPIGVITPFTNAQHHVDIPGSNTAGRQRAFADSLRRWVAACQQPHVCLFEGTDILDDFTLLSSDLIHPAESGQTRMAWNLARMLHTAEFPINKPLSIPAS